MEFNFFDVSPLLLERRDANMDRIFYLEDKISDIEKRWRKDRHGHNHVNVPLLEEVKNKRIKAHENDIKRLKSDNKNIDLEILNKWRVKNGLAPKYRNSNGNLTNLLAI